MSVDDLASLRFPLDQRTLCEAEEAAARFVSGPWYGNFPEAFGTVTLNGTGPLNTNGDDQVHGSERMAGTAMPGPMAGPITGAGASVATFAGWAPMQMVPMESTWAAISPSHASTGVSTAPAAAVLPPGTFVPAGMVTGVQMSAPSHMASSFTPVAAPPSGMPTSTVLPAARLGNALGAGPRELWSNMSDDTQDYLHDPAGSAEVAPGCVNSEIETGSASQHNAGEHSEPQPTEGPQGRGDVNELLASEVAVGAAATHSTEDIPVMASREQSDAAELSPSQPSGAPAPPASSNGASPVASTSTSHAASASSSAPSRDFVQPRSWVNVVSKNSDATTLTGRLKASTSSTAPTSKRDGGDEPRAKKDTIIDLLLFLSKQRGEFCETHSNGRSVDVPEELRKFSNCLDSMNNISRAKYVRRGMKNDANNCYVNVVIQSLLPCSALMQLLSHCAQSDPDRPFYTGMVRVCKEFHSKRPDAHMDAFNVLQLPQVKEIISTWQSIGAQQDAGEFLFYMLNGMHEECKWKVLPFESSQSLRDAMELVSHDGSNHGHVDDESQKAEVRSAGVQEDSPILRIFGGLIRSSLRSKNASADSVSVEPFNHLILDISAAGVDSLWSALEAHCGAEAVNEGQATKRLQFKVLPKVLVVNLKRFSYNKETGCPQKIKKPVKYDEKLCFDKSWLVDGVEPQEYQLTAVICHHGDSVNGGHYNAAVRYNSEWYMYDDAVVRQMELREVINQQFAAYLLLYQCHDKVDIRP